MATSLADIQALSSRDNWRNLIYIGRVYLILAVAIGGAVWFYYVQQSAGISFLWNIPVTLLAVAMVGASQHQLGGATHEATHFTLFRNRRMNELVSDWLCMFPLYSSTYQFRIYEGSRTAAASCWSTDQRHAH